MNESWLQVISLFMANAGLIIWFRSESRNDWRHMDTKVDAIRQDSKEFQLAMLTESKDFHARLIALKERNFKK